MISVAESGLTEPSPLEPGGLVYCRRPVCHQSVSLVARHLERHGIATVVIGSARDIVELCGVPRFIFSDFPLGNAAGRAHDPTSQDLTLALAMQLLQDAPAPRTTVQSPLRWQDDPAWKLDYLNAERLTEQERHRLRAENDQAKRVAKALKLQRIARPR